MPALIENLPHLTSLAPAQQPNTGRLLSRVTGASGLPSITDGLAQVLGQGLGAAPMPRFGPQASPPTTPAMPADAPRDHPTAGMTVEQLLHKLQPVPAPAPQPLATPVESHDNIESMRMEMFGKYYQEIEGRMAELRQTLDGGVGRARRAMLERVDELGAALHRDMVALRQETQKELEDLKRDVFTTVMSLSAINDKMGLADSRNRETWVALTKALTDRIDQQARLQKDAIDNFRHGVDDGMEQRVAQVVETTLMRLAAARRAAGASAPLTATASAESPAA